MYLRQIILFYSNKRQRYSHYYRVEKVISKNQSQVKVIVLIVFVLIHVSVGGVYLYLCWYECLSAED